MKPDLLYLGAGYPVLRLKPFQERGDDIGTETTPEKGANRMYHSANRRTNQDKCSVKMAYLRNNEEFYNETNFHAFYTQLGVISNCKHLRNYYYQEDKNFKSISSICEHPSLEVASNPTKKHSDQNQSMNFKMDVLSSQQDQEEEKIPRKSQDTIIFPEPVKPSNLWKDWTINWSNCFQTELNQPGRILHDPRLPEYTSNRPEEPPIIFPYTNKHRIKRIFIYTNFLFSKSLTTWRINNQRLFFYDQSFLKLLQGT